jgi:hypothetical protein
MVLFADTGALPSSGLVQVQSYVSSALLGITPVSTKITTLLLTFRRRTV